jgi:hypothetical protein
VSVPLRRLFGLLLLLTGFWPSPGVAHESQPGLLEVRQLTAERWEVVWRAPIYYGKPHPAGLALPPAWQLVGEPRLRRLATSDLHRQIVTVPPGTLDGSVVGFPGLEQTITDVVVRVSRLGAPGELRAWPLLRRGPAPQRAEACARARQAAGGDQRFMGLRSDPCRSMRTGFRPSLPRTFPT